MGLSSCGICSDWHQHDDARSSAAILHAPVELNGRPGGIVFLYAIFWQLSRDAGDELAPAAPRFFESHQRGIFLLRAWIGVPGAGTLVFFGDFRGDLRNRLR